jgi:hypothetical protein
MNDNEKTPKNAHKYVCNICDFKCSKQSDLIRHNLRPKHILNEKRYKKDNYSNEKTPHSNFICICGKSYQYASGLWRHRQTCNIIKKTPDNNFINDNINVQEITPELLIKLIEQNKELQQTLIDQNKTIIELAQKTGNNNYFTNSSTNSNNKTFNLQIFLNETCKDAINLTDFVDQIKLSINDLEETGKIGYAEGISKVFIKNLNGIDLTRRPIHCSDSKRETIYIKDENQWSKDENKTGLTKAIKHVANKNIKQISEWQKVNPEYNNPDSKQNDKYMKIILNSMSGSTKEESDKNYEKIVKNIAKETIIEKS